MIRILPIPVYAKIDFGKNVHVFDIEPECVELSDTKTSGIWCQLSEQRTRTIEISRY